MTGQIQSRTDAEILAAWSSDVSVIADRMRSLVNHADTYGQVFAIIRKLEATGRIKEEFDWAFPTWFLEVGADSMTIRVRQFVDTDPRNHSLLLLLEDMRANARILTRQRYLDIQCQASFDAISRAATMQTVDLMFSKRFGGPTAQHVSELVIDSQIQKLKRGCGHVADYANRFVAHFGKKPGGQPLGYFKLLEAIQEVVSVSIFAWDAVDAGDPTNPLLSFKGNWTRIFQTAWLSVGESPPEYTRLYEEWGERTDLKKAAAAERQRKNEARKNRKG